MKTFLAIDEIWRYDDCVADCLADILAGEVDENIKFGQTHETLTAREVCPGWKPSKDFEKTFKLHDLSAVFSSGEITVTAKNGELAVRLSSKQASAHSHVVNRVFLSLGRGLGINGTGNSWIDTEDEIGLESLNDKFIKINALSTSVYPGSETGHNELIVNVSGISHVVPMGYYEWAELRIKQQRKSK